MLVRFSKYHISYNISEFHVNQQYDKLDAALFILYNIINHKISFNHLRIGKQEANKFCPCNYEWNCVIRLHFNIASFAISTPFILFSNNFFKKREKPSITPTVPVTEIKATETLNQKTDPIVKLCDESPTATITPKTLLP